MLSYWRRPGLIALLAVFGVGVLLGSAGSVRGDTSLPWDNDGLCLRSQFDKLDRRERYGEILGLWILYYWSSDTYVRDRATSALPGVVALTGDVKLMGEYAAVRESWDKTMAAYTASEGKDADKIVPLFNVYKDNYHRFLNSVLLGFEVGIPPC